MEVLSLATGFFLGVRHCLEPDHLTAVAHFASAARTTREGLKSGLLWGAGHSAALLVVALALLGFEPHLDGLAPFAERAVGATLIALSIWRLRSLRRRPHVHPHAHDAGLVHTHAHAHEKGHLHTHAPTLTGLVHGAAGALGVAAVSMAVPAVSLVSFAVAFGAGTLVAMGAAGGLAARLYSSAAAAGWERSMVALTGACGFLLGLFWIASA